MSHVHKAHTHVKAVLNVMRYTFKTASRYIFKTVLKHLSLECASRLEALHIQDADKRERKRERHVIR